MHGPYVRPRVPGLFGSLPGFEGVCAKVADRGRGGDGVTGAGEALGGTVPPTIVQDSLDVEVR